MHRIQDSSSIPTLYITNKKSPEYSRLLTGVVGIEPTSGVLETLILPMNYTPILLCHDSSPQQTYYNLNSKKTQYLITSFVKVLYLQNFTQI